MSLKSKGDGTVAPGAKYQVNSGAESIVAADFNRDGKIDLAINGLNDYSVAVLVGNGDGTFVPPTNANDDTPRPFGFVTWGYPARSEERRVGQGCRCCGAVVAE